jgi:hypothetical protein
VIQSSRPFVSSKALNNVTTGMAHPFSIFVMLAGPAATHEA